MSTPVVYIALLLHCIAFTHHRSYFLDVKKDKFQRFVFGKRPLKGGFGAFEIFCCLARIGISPTTFSVMCFTYVALLLSFLLR